MINPVLPQKYCSIPPFVTAVLPQKYCSTLTFNIAVLPLKYLQYTGKRSKAQSHSFKLWQLWESEYRLLANPLDNLWATRALRLSFYRHIAQQRLPQP